MALLKHLIRARPDVCTSKPNRRLQSENLKSRGLITAHNLFTTLISSRYAHNRSDHDIRKFATLAVSPECITAKIFFMP